MEHEDQCKEPQDRSDENDDRRVCHNVREVKTKKAFALLVAGKIRNQNIDGQ